MTGCRSITNASERESVRLASRIWNGMRDQATLEKFLDVSPGLFYSARKARVFVEHWSPSGDAYYSDDDVAGFDEFLAQFRYEHRLHQPGAGDPVSPGAKERITRLYESRRGVTLLVELCQSCDQAISPTGHCAGCS